jgi:hypothetical protein
MIMPFDKLRVTERKLRVTERKLRVTERKLRVTRLRRSLDSASLRSG